MVFSGFFSVIQKSEFLPSVILSLRVEIVLDIIRSISVAGGAPVCEGESCVAVEKVYSHG